MLNSNSQLTRNEETAVDLLVHLANQTTSFKLDFLSYSLLKVIRVFRDCKLFFLIISGVITWFAADDKPDMPDKHVVKSVYLKLHEYVYHTMKARYDNVAVNKRGDGHVESFQTYFKSLMEFMNDLDSLAKVITSISPFRWPAIFKVCQ